MSILTKKNKTKTVEQVLNVFNTAIAELDVIQVSQDNELNRIQAEIDLLEAKRSAALAESEKAKTAAINIKKLLGGEN